MATVQHLDRRLSEIVRRLSLGPLEGVAFVAGSAFTHPKTVVPLFLLGAAASARLDPSGGGTLLNRVAYALVCIACTQMVAFTGKRVFRRPRPKLDRSVARAYDIRSKIAGGKSENESFPSGDTAAGSAWAAAMSVLTGSPLWLLVPPMVAFARVYFHCHWLGDTVAGAVIGVTVPWLLDASLGGWQAFGALHIAVFFVLYIGYMLWMSGGLVDPTNVRRSEIVG